MNAIATVNELINMINENKKFGIEAVCVYAGSKDYTYKNFEKLSAHFGESKCRPMRRPMMVDGLMTITVGIVD